MYGFTDPHRRSRIRQRICIMLPYIAHIYFEWHVKAKAVRHVCPWGYSIYVLKLYWHVPHEYQI